MKRKRYLYHVTDPENVESILRNGLLRGGGKRQSFAVYLSEDPLLWWNPGMKILKVDMKGLFGEMSGFEPWGSEWLYWGDIPAKRIKVYEPNTVELIRMNDAYTKAIVELSKGGKNAD